MISRVFDLWTEGLADALVSLKGRIRHPKRFRLRSEGRQLALYWTEVSPSRKIAAVDIDAPEKVSAETLRETRGGVIEIVVPSAAILDRHLGILPAESRPFLDQVVRHRIETIFPWRAFDMVYATKSETCDDGRLNVSVRATTRSAIAAALKAAEAYKASEIYIVGGQEPSTKILASIGAERQSEATRARLLSRYALISIMILFVVMVGWTTFTSWSLNADITALDKTIAGRRAIIVRKAAASEAIGSNWLEGKKSEAPLAISVLNDLAQILPADTYLTEFNFEAGRVRMTGISANVANLVSLLEGSQRFKNASFFTPTTRLAATSGDRFSIEATAQITPETTK